jgi:hypothetical protein
VSDPFLLVTPWQGRLTSHNTWAQAVKVPRALTLVDFRGAPYTYTPIVPSMCVPITPWVQFHIPPPQDLKAVLYMQAWLNTTAAHTRKIQVP